MMPNTAPYKNDPDRETMDRLAKSVREKIMIKEPVKEDSLVDHLEVSCTAINELISSSFGPKGFNKLIINPVNEIVVTNDGKTILEEIDVLHPVVTSLKNLAKSMDKACGDGTKTAVILASGLIKNAIKLIRMGVHPNTIIKGYRLSLNKAYDLLEYSSRPAASPAEVHSAVLSSVVGKGVEESLAEGVTTVVMQTIDHLNRVCKGERLDLNRNVKVLKKTGAPETVFLEGVILDERPAREDMPDYFDNPSILLLNYDLKVKSEFLNSRHNLTMDSRTTSHLFSEAQKAHLKGLAEKVLHTGADVVFNEGDVDPIVEEVLAKHGVLLFKKLKLKDMEKIERATGARLMTIHDDLGPECLGKADEIEVRKKCYENFVHITVKDQPIVTVLIWAAVKYDLNKIEEAVDDALNNAAFLSKNNKIVTGGGGIEFETAQMLRYFAGTISGKEQLAVLEYANALEMIPITLARNTGMNPLDAVAKLENEYSRGLDARVDISGKITGNSMSPVYDTASIKKLALISASETALNVLRVDEIIPKK